MSKNCAICGEQVDGGVVCHKECADMVKDIPELRKKIDGLINESLLGLKGWADSLEEAARLLEQQAAGRVLEIPEDADDIDIGKYTPEQLKAIVKQNIALMDMLRCYKEKMADGRLVELSDGTLKEEMEKFLAHSQMRSDYYELMEAKREGRCVILPRKVGDKVNSAKYGEGEVVAWDTTARVKYAADVKPDWPYMDYDINSKIFAGSEVVPSENIEAAEKMAAEKKEESNLLDGVPLKSFGDYWDAAAYNPGAASEEKGETVIFENDYCPKCGCKKDYDGDGYTFTCFKCGFIYPRPTAEKKEGTKQ